MLPPLGQADSPSRLSPGLGGDPRNVIRRRTLGRGVRASERCPKCESPAVRAYGSVRAGGGPLSVGDVFADAFTVVSQFTAYVCQDCGYTEFYRRQG